MGIITKSKLKSLNINYLPKSWQKLSDNELILIDGKLVVKPLVPKRTIKQFIFI